jgi:hypothetical protein
MGGCGLDLSVLGLGPVTGSCEQGNELLGSVICEELLNSCEFIENEESK